MKKWTFENVSEQQKLQLLSIQNKVSTLANFRYFVASPSYCVNICQNIPVENTKLMGLLYAFVCVLCCVCSTLPCLLKCSVLFCHCSKSAVPYGYV